MALAFQLASLAFAWLLGVILQMHRLARTVTICCMEMADSSDASRVFRVRFQQALTKEVVFDIVRFTSDQPGQKSLYCPAQVKIEHFLPLTKVPLIP